MFFSEKELIDNTFDKKYFISIQVAQKKKSYLYLTENGNNVSISVYRQVLHKMENNRYKIQNVNII